MMFCFHRFVLAKVNKTQIKPHAENVHIAHHTLIIFKCKQFIVNMFHCEQNYRFTI